MFSRYFFPSVVNNSSIPSDFNADVNLNAAPISSAYFLAFSSGTASESNKSDLFAAIPITIIKILYIYKNEHTYIVW